MIICLLWDDRITEVCGCKFRYFCHVGQKEAEEWGKEPILDGKNYV